MIINLKKLPDGRCRIHWFVRDEKGPIVTAKKIVNIKLEPLQLGGAKGYIACNPAQNSTREQRGNEIFLCLYTDEPMAVTCPECCKTEKYIETMAQSKSG